MISGRTTPRRVLYVVNEDFAFLLNRLPMARAARDAGFEVHVATNVNKGAEAIYGYAPEEVLGKSSDLLIPADATGESRGLRGRSVAGGRSVIASAGVELWFHPLGRRFSAIRTACRARRSEGRFSPRLRIPISFITRASGRGRAAWDSCI